MATSTTQTGSRAIPRLVQGARPELDDSASFGRSIAQLGHTPTLSLTDGPFERNKALLEARLAQGDGPLAVQLDAEAGTADAWLDHLAERGGIAAVFVRNIDEATLEHAMADRLVATVDSTDGLLAALRAGARQVAVETDGGSTKAARLPALGPEHIFDAADAGGIRPARLHVHLAPSRLDDEVRGTLAQWSGQLEGEGISTGLIIPGAAYLNTSEAVRDGAITKNLQRRIAATDTAQSQNTTTLSELDDLARAALTSPTLNSAPAASTSDTTHARGQKAMSSKPSKQDSRTDERAIAIVGVGAKMPGALSADAFWENITNEVDAIQDVPADRWDPELYYDPDPEAPDKTYSKLGGWVTGFEFDRKFYTIPPFVVQRMEPSQRLALETVREALEDSGYLDADFDRERCSVIMGNTLGGELRDWTNLRVHYPEFAMSARETLMKYDGSNLSQREVDEIMADLEERFKGRFQRINEDSMPGELPNVIAGRIANNFNLRGENFVTDAACAGSLAAIEQAVQGLRDGRFDMAVTGGVDRFMGPSAFVKFCKIGALSPDGSRPFDENANGFIMGEGCGVMILKRLSDAERDNDDIYAVIRGVGGSSDGKGKGITAPNPTGQQLSLGRAYEDAGYGPRSVSLFEAHGTATPVGDPAEFESTWSVIAEDNGPAGAEHIALGSVKSMIGHLKAGAGAASMLKTAMALHNKTLPPTINCETLNPRMNIEETPFRIQHHAEPWETNGDMPRRAGVSAFGFGGTNFHITLEEYDPDRNAKHWSGHTGDTQASTTSGMDGGMSTSGQSTSGQSTSGQSTSGQSTSGQSTSGGNNLDDIDVSGGLLALTADSEDELATTFAALKKGVEEQGLEATRQWHLDLEGGDFELPEAPVRMAIAYGDREELDKQFGRIERAFERGKGWNILSNQGVYRGEAMRDGKIAMLFPGQGTQYLGMLSDLKESFPVVQRVFDEADRVMTPVLGEPLSKIIDPDEWDDAAKDRLKQTENTQPAVLTADVALLELLRHFGLDADMVAGHSLGEYGALVAAGVMPFENALQTVARRGTAMAEASPMNGDNGLMASIPLPPDEVEERLAEIDGYVVCANKNCPRQTIIAGLTEPTKKAAEMFEDDGHMVQFLNVSHAFHSKVVAAGSEPLREHLESIEVEAPKIPILTNVTGDYHPNDPDAIRDLLARQVAAPVEWMTQIERMYEDGARTFLEVGPKSALTTFTESVLGRGGDYVATHTNHPKEGGEVSLYRALGRLWAEGVWTNERRAGQPSPSEGEDSGGVPSDAPSRDELMDTMLTVLCEKTGYDPDEIEFDFELEADLGVDTVKQAEILAEVREEYGLPKDEDFRFSDYPTLERLGDYVEERFEAADLAGSSPSQGEDSGGVPQDGSQTEDTPSQSSPSQSMPSRDELMDTMLTVLCEKTGYDPDEIEFDFELEADLGVDTVKQAEILAEVREEYGLPKDEDFRFSDYPTLERLGDYVEERFEAADLGGSSPSQGEDSGGVPQDGSQTEDTPSQSSPSQSMPSRDELMDTMLTVLCEKTGYDPDEIEFDFELEADLGVDTVKQAEILAEVREEYGLPKDEDFRFSDYPTLERLGDYVEERFEAAGGEATASVDAPSQAAAREVKSEAPSKPAGEGASDIHQHDIPASIVISGGSVGLPGTDEVFCEDAVDRLLNGENFIEQLSDELRQKIVDKNITRLEKQEGGGGHFVELTELDEVLQLAARAGDFDLADWGVPERLIKALDRTSELAFAAGLEALRDAGIPLEPRYRETRSGKKITTGWKLPGDIGDETGVIFGTAFAGRDAVIDELNRFHTDEDYEFNHRILLQMLGMANARFAEYIGARGPNTSINNACASTTTAVGMAQDWIQQGRCERVIVLSSDDVTSDTLIDWVGSGFLATGAATTQEDVEEAALPFDRRRNGMIVGMGAVGLVVEEGGVPEARGIEPLADVLGTRYVNSAHHPTRLDVDHISREVGQLVERAEGDFELDRADIAERTVFVSHETYTPARGGSADAEISAIRSTFGENADDIVIANTKGFTGHAQGASIEDILAIKALQRQRVPRIANFEEPDPNLGELRLSEGGDYPVDYALRLAAGFGSQLALALYRFRARTEDRTYNPARYSHWLSEVTGFANPETAVEDRTLRVREGQPGDQPTDLNDPSGGGASVDTPDETADDASGQTNVTETPGAPVTADVPPANDSADISADEVAPRVEDTDDRFPVESVLVEAHTSAAYDPLELRERLEGRTVVILAGPMLVTNLMRRAAERCGADVLVIEDSRDRNPLDSDETTCDLFDEAAVAREFGEAGRVDGIINLLGFGRDESNRPSDGEGTHRVARQTFHVARAWVDHLGGEPKDGQFFLSVTGMGGRLGFDQATNPLPVCGAVCGLTKSLAREWEELGSEADIRVVDVPREGLYPDLGLQILAETFADTSVLEVGLLGGVRYQPVTVEADEILGRGAGRNTSVAPTSDSVILLAGGGKGITARVAKDLAKRFGSKLALVGRTELSHPDPLSVNMDQAKAEAKERIDARGERVTPVRVRDELKPLKSQRTIQQNMQEMRAAGASDVAYFSCDVSEADEVDGLIERVVDHFGRIDGVIHGAGAEISEQLTDKTPETFDIVFRGKALGGLNLWNSVRDHAPSFFVTFSSVAARFGNVGQCDYSAANEVLNKLVAQINATTDVAALSFDWTAWDEIGMAVAGSMKTILEHRGVEFLPPAVGAPMVGDALEDGLTGEVLVAGELGGLQGSAGMRRRVPASEHGPGSDTATGTPPKQLAFSAKVTERDGDSKLVVERVFDPERDRFLNDHIYEGVPVLPGVMGFEMMEETARQLVGRPVAQMRDVRFERAIKLHHGDPIRVIATAETVGRENGEPVVDLTIETERTVKTGRTIRSEHFSGTARFDRPEQAEVADVEPMSFDADELYEAGPDRPEIYRRFFHTGLFQVMEEVPHLGEDVVVGYGRNPRGQLIADQSNQQFTTDPMVREMGFQTTGLWGMIENRASYLPLGVGRAIQYGRAGSGERVCIRARRRDDASEHAIAFDVEIHTDQGRLLQRMEKVELIGHRKLTDEEAFSEQPTRRMTLFRLSQPEAEALLSDRGLQREDILTDTEMTSWDRLRSDRRRGEWLAARVAGKELVSRHIRDFTGYRPALGDIVIRKNENGAPRGELRGETRRRLPDFQVPNLTITHAQGVAIAGLAGPGPAARIGIDLEGIEPRGDSFAENYFSVHERSLTLPAGDQDNAQADDSTTWTALWSIKEAVSKSLGLGLKLALSELHVDALEKRGGHITADLTLKGKARETYEALGAESLEVRVQADGTFVLASAHLSIDPDARRVDQPTDPDRGVGANGNGTHAKPGLEEASTADVNDRTAEEFAAVAALLKHKGLLDAERTQKESSHKRGEELSSWKKR